MYAPRNNSGVFELFCVIISKTVKIDGNSRWTKNMLQFSLCLLENIFRWGKYLASYGRDMRRNGHKPSCKGKVKLSL
jgi:hypothetical protein